MDEEEIAILCGLMFVFFVIVSWFNSTSDSQIMNREIIKISGSQYICREVENEKEKVQVSSPVVKSREVSGHP